MMVALSKVAVESVPVSRVVDDVFEPGGERDCAFGIPRPIWLIDGVVKERGNVEDGLRSLLGENAVDEPSVCDEKRFWRGDWKGSDPPARTSSWLVGGCP